MTSACRRIAISWLAALCTVLQLGAAVHFALVRHEVCPEHGELVHAHAADPAAGEHVARSGVRHEIPGYEAAPDSAEDGHEHDHCLVAGANVPPSGGRAATVERARRRTPPLSNDVASLERVAFAPSLRTRLLLAPKNSPPACVGSVAARRVI